jgi:hypothetical protein
MPELTKKEAAFFILFALGALGVLVMTLVLWADTQPKNCWNNHDTEQAAIQECEL